jgi:putative two-component system response regulator
MERYIPSPYKASPRGAGAKPARGKKRGREVITFGRIVTDDPAGHISAGLDIVSSLNMHPWLEPYIRSHHEKMNVEGFPDGLKAEQLPLNIRILTEVNRFVELMEEDEESAVRKLGDECGKQYWSTEVFKALKLVLKDDDFKKKLSLTAER